MSVRRSLVAAVFAGTLGALALAPAAQAAPADAPTTADPAQAAAGWLVTQLVGGNHLETVFGSDSFPDQGLTADAILAFDAAQVAHDSATAATTWLSGADVLTQYVGDGGTESFAGAHAKAALVAEAQGLDPTHFGGRDLLAELRDLQAASGRFTDRSQFGDFSNGIGQSLAVIALQRAGGSGAPAAAVGFLAGSQCDNGGFPLNFGQPACTPDPDTTAYVVQALLAVGKDAAAGDALDWLASIQGADGGFGGSGPTAAENSNSTGLVAQALRVGGRAAAADRAVGYLKARQVGCGAPGTQLGAIAYDSSGFAATAARATTQAIPGIAGTGLFAVSGSGAADGAPRLACAPPTTTTPPTTSSNPPTSSSAPSSSAPAGGASGGGGTLPATGTPVAVLGAVGAALLAGGILLVRAGRRRAGRALPVQ